MHAYVQTRASWTSRDARQKCLEAVMHLQFQGPTAGRVHGPAAGSPGMSQQKCSVCSRKCLRARVCCVCVVCVRTCVSTSGNIWIGATCASARMRTCPGATCAHAFGSKIILREACVLEDREWWCVRLYVCMFISWVHVCLDAARVHGFLDAVCLSH